MNPFLGSYMLDVIIMMGTFAVFAALQLLLLSGVGWLLHYRWRNNVLCCLLPSMALSIAIAVVVIPSFIGLAGLWRYDSPAGIVFGHTMLREDWKAYASSARLAFLVLYAALVVLGGMVGFLQGGRTNHKARAGMATSVAQLLYLIETLGFADIFNACVIGIPFLLRASC